MSDQGNRTPGPPLDLSRVTESTRRALYEAVVAVHFNPTAEELRQVLRTPEDAWVSTYSADEAGLAVFHAFGRGFAVWRVLDAEDGAPESQRWEVLRIGPGEEGRNEGLEFYEV